MNGFLSVAIRSIDWDFPVRKAMRMIRICAECGTRVKSHRLNEDQFVSFCERCHKLDPMTVEVSEKEYNEHG